VRKLVYTASARHDIQEIAAFIADESSSRRIAEAFASRLRDRCARLAVLPGTLGRDRSELRPGLRSVAVGNYIILFRYGQDSVETTANGIAKTVIDSASVVDTRSVATIIGVHRNLRGTGLSKLS
jgi:toxin ParE1/3/4